ncbi:hypothetical protein Tco_1475194 [Tanacetum coccineum]
MGKGEDEIKFLVDIDIELQSGTDKLIEKLSQEKDSQEEAVGEFNSTLDNIVEMLSQEKDSPDDFYGFMYDTDDNASISDQANDQDEALFDQEVADESFNDEEVEQARPSKWIRVTQEEIIKDEKAKKG